MPRLSVVIIALNEEKNILRCLESVKPVADEIVVVDSGSTDRTADLCREFGCRVFHRTFDGYGKQKQFAVDQAVNDWVFSLDADEVVTAGLKEEILGIFCRSENNPSTHPSSTNPTVENLKHLPHPASRDQVSGFRIPFSLFFMGRILKHGGVGKEYHLRIFDRREGGFTGAPVHEGIEVKGNLSAMQGKIIHYSYRDIRHHLEKINTYTSQAAAGYHARKRSFSKCWVALKFPISFFSFYIIKLGFLDGYQGFMWSFLAAVYASLKIAKTIELTEKPC
ncbi:MAG: glycosyltransferase family 2 protein [Bacteroidales bacterium]|nr:glycosyltransferase family 2 protein [Bacteroidales bacterium]